jgi:hypothetical protein
VANDGIRCSVISLSAEVNIWKKLAERTDGKYFVPLDPIDVSDKLEELSRPPVESSSRQGVLVKMGFPQKEADERYICPQCRTRVKGRKSLMGVDLEYSSNSNIVRRLQALARLRRAFSSLLSSPFPSFNCNAFDPRAKRGRDRPGARAKPV